MSITIGGKLISKNPSIATSFRFIRINQTSVVAADGEKVVFDNGVNVIVGSIVIRNVVDTEAIALRTFLRDTAVFELNSFTIEPPTNTDLGEGKGTDITTAFYNGGATTGGVFEFAGNSSTFNINFPYRKVLP